MERFNTKWRRYACNINQKWKLQRETCLKESVSLLWTCWDSGKGGNHVQTKTDIAFRTQQNYMDKGYTNLGVPQTFPIADIIEVSFAFSRESRNESFRTLVNTKSNECEMKEKIIETLRESMNWKCMISQNPGMERISSQKIQ